MDSMMKTGSSTAVGRILSVAFLVAFSAAVAAKPVSFKTKYLTISLDNGNIVSMKANATGKEYLAKPSPILQIRLFSDGDNSVKNYPPTGMKWVKPGSVLQLSYAGGVSVQVGVKAKPTHVVFKVLKVSPKNKVELVLWGPYATKINRTIGETVGVVYNKEFALGIQSLNLRTLGGYPGPRKGQDIIKVSSGDDKNVYDDIAEVATVRKKHRFWGNTAWRTSYGSVLQAFCRDRTKPKDIYPGFHADTYPSCVVTGSKIALFGCPGKRSVILNTLSAIEVAEGLPHPVMDGIWAKKNPDAISIFLAWSCQLDNMDPYLEWAKDTPVKTIYYDTPGPFADHGEFKHFVVGGDVAGYKRYVEKIKQAGFWVGSLTLSTMISPKTTYVRNADPRLKSIGECKLASSIDASTTSIAVKNPTPSVLKFAYPGRPNVLRIDRELIQYSGVQQGNPARLTGCRRGAYGTGAAAHKAGAKGYKLYCNPFVGNADLDTEIAKNKAAYDSTYGIRNSPFDGLEFLDSEGNGDYSRARYMMTWYKNMPKNQRGNVVTAASNANHFGWHVITRYEWGDEGGSFDLRSGNKDYRNMNLCYYYRNFTPLFMDQIIITPKTTLDEAEWYFARSAGFDAGYRVKIKDAKALLASETNKKIRTAMKAWESARLAKAFPKSLRPFLQDVRAEFHIEQIGPKQWKLYPRPDPKDRTKLGQPIIIPVKGKLDKKTIARFAPPPEKHYKLTATSFIAEGPPKNAIDGLINLHSYWAAGPYPQSLTIDLGEMETLHGIHLWPFFTSGRYFQYTVEVSKDQKNWKKVVDMSKNTKVATQEGAKFNFSSPVKCRYIRINMLYHNMSKTVFLVEVKWF